MPYSFFPLQELFFFPNLEHQRVLDLKRSKGYSCAFVISDINLFRTGLPVANPRVNLPFVDGLYIQPISDHIGDDLLLGLPH